MNNADALKSDTGPMFHAAADSSVMSTELGDGIALLDLRVNEYFTLNGVGAFLWRQLQVPRSRADLIDAVLDQYEADPASCASDIDTMLGDLIAAQLVEIR